MPSPTPAMPPGCHLESNRHGRVFLRIAHPAVHARIALEGAHIVECTPAGQGPLLWLSPEEPCMPGLSLRGGIPVCWPWFGSTRPGPAHGIARNSIWTLDQVQTSDDQVVVRLSLEPTVIAEQLPDEAWRASIEFVLGADLRVALTTANIGSNPQRLSQALHTYLPIADLAQARVEGLENARYIDQLSGEHSVQRQHLLEIHDETDRIYFNHGAPVTLINGEHDRLIVSREGSDSLVVWNPWIDKSLRLNHFAPDGYRQMLCLEAANTGPDTLTLAPGQSHRLATRIARA